jgi:hypothetical protein
MKILISDMNMTCLVINSPKGAIYRGYMTQYYNTKRYIQLDSKTSSILKITICPVEPLSLMTAR